MNFLQHFYRFVLYLREKVVLTLRVGIGEENFLSFRFIVNNEISLKPVHNTWVFLYPVGLVV